MNPALRMLLGKTDSDPSRTGGGEEQVKGRMETKYEKGKWEHSRPERNEISTSEE